MHLRLSQHWNTQGTAAKPQLWTQVFKHLAVSARKFVFLNSELVLTTFPVLTSQRSCLQETQTNHKASKFVLGPPLTSKLSQRCLVNAQILQQGDTSTYERTRDPAFWRKNLFWCDNARDNYIGSLICSMRFLSGQITIVLGRENPPVLLSI